MRADLTLSRAAMALTFAACVSLGAPLAAQVPATEDLRALLYYMDTNDQRAVQAEMRRLRGQFPMWTPPTDLNTLRAQAAPQAGVDVAPIWARIERGDTAGARALIDQARARAPAWSPDAEMVRVLELAEGQAAFDAAYARRDASELVAVVRRTPALMSCERINNAWQLAEVYHQTSQTPMALATYRGVLTSCTRAQDSVPTLEKANEIASLAEITALFETARTAAPANAATLNQLEARLRAGRGAPPLAAGTTAPAAQPAAAATAPRPAAAPAPSPSTPSPSALAAASGGAASAAPVGTQLPLRGDSRIAQVRAQKEAGNWGACLAQSARPRSIELLYERSWCAYNMDRPGEALVGFSSTARTGSQLGATVGRDASFGMILSYLAMNMTEDAARIAAATDLTMQQRREVEATILDQRGIRAYHNQNYAQAVAYFNALEQLTGSLRRDLAILRGYAYLNGGQRDRARAEFERLHSQLATPETRMALQGLAETPVDG